MSAFRLIATDARTSPDRQLSAISGHGDQFLLQGHASERVKEQRLFGVSKAEQASLYQPALNSQTFPYRGEPRLSGQ